MTIHTFVGFDGFGGDSDANGRPTDGAGLVLNPARGTVAKVLPAAARVGVSTDPRFMVGRGADRRRSVSFYLDLTTTSQATMTASFPIDRPSVFLPSTLGSTLVVGYRVKRCRAQAAVPAAWVNSWFFMLNLSGVNVVAYSMGSGAFSIGAGQTTGRIDFVEDQEYYIELVVTRQSGTNASLQLFVDGNRMPVSGADPVVTIPLTGPTTWSLGGNFSTGRYAMAMCFADFYFGTVRLGPKKVITRQPSVVIESNWKPSEGTDPLAMITGEAATDDNKYIISPESTAPDKYRIDFNLGEGYKTYAAAMYLRGKRDQASIRKVKADIFNRSTGTQIEPEKSIPIDYSQQLWRTDTAWFTDVEDSLTRSNINNMAVNLSATES